MRISKAKSAKIIINMHLLFAFYRELKFAFMCGIIDDGMENCRQTKIFNLIG